MHMGVTKPERVRPPDVQQSQTLSPESVVEKLVPLVGRCQVGRTGSYCLNPNS